MNLTRNVTVIQSEGAECFVCEKTISFDERAIRVRFNVDAILTTVAMNKHMHLDCAARLHELLGQRIREAKES